MLYTIQGTSTGIRLNERLTYVVSEAAQLSTGEIDFSDASRKADTLLALGLNPLTADGILSIANLAANSDVETFIASTNIQYGEVQDLVNYYEDQSGGEVVVDSNDLVHFRYEIKNNLFGKGFTIKNSRANQSNDDADDTMYLINKNWSYEDDFYKSSNYANRFYALLPGESQQPPLQVSAGFVRNIGASGTTREWAVKFKPNHPHWLPGDIYVLGSMYTQMNSELGTHVEPAWRFRIVADTGNTPNNGSVVANIDFPPGEFPNEDGTAGTPPRNWANTQFFNDTSNNPISEFTLDITRYYWLMLSDENTVSSNPAVNIDMRWGLANVTNLTTLHQSDSATMSTDSNAGNGWNAPTVGNIGVFFPRQRSHSFFMYDPKAMQAVESGLTAGLPTDTLLTDAPSQVTTFDSMYRFMQQQTYNLTRPRTVYNFPTVMASNIPILPGDPIVISDSILGFSTSGKQVVLATCGDMTYQWGAMGSGSYEAPTNLSIQAIGVHARYR